MRPEELFEQNIGLAYAIAKPTDEDTAQQALIGLWRACLVYDPEKGTLSAIARRYIRAEIRQKKAIQTVSLDTRIAEDLVLMDVIEGSPDVDTDARLRDCIAKLTPLQRDVCQMLEEGLTPKQIGKALGMSQSKVRQTIYRIRVKLRREDE